MAEALGKIDNYLESKGVKDGIIKGRTNSSDYSVSNIDAGLPKTTSPATTNVPVTTTSTFTPDSAKPNNGTVSINLRDKPNEAIAVVVTDKKINHDAVIKQLKEKGITDKADVDNIIKEIEAKLK